MPTKAGGADAGDHTVKWTNHISDRLINSGYSPTYLAFLNQKEKLKSIAEKMIPIISQKNTTAKDAVAQLKVSQDADLQKLYKLFLEMKRLTRRSQQSFQKCLIYPSDARKFGPLRPR